MSTNHRQRYDVEHCEQWREAIDKIPALSFPRTWKVKVIPPFAGAMARFIAVSGKKSISVYLDMHESLGYFDGPYWEAYPVNGDTYRCEIGNGEELINAMKREFRKRGKSKEL
jgi:hypothetical protein